MNEQRCFTPFIKESLGQHDFNWLVLLGYVPKPISELRRQWEEIWKITDPEQRYWKSKETAPGAARKCLDIWLEELAAACSHSYLVIEDYRCGGEARFHVLVADCRGGCEDLINRWKEVSGRGWAFTRPLGDKIGGLLGYLVMKAGYTLEVTLEGCRDRYSADDFRPWR